MRLLALLVVFLYTLIPLFLAHHSPASHSMDPSHASPSHNHQPGDQGTISPQFGMDWSQPRPPQPSDGSRGNVQNAGSSTGRGRAPVAYQTPGVMFFHRPRLSPPSPQDGQVSHVERNDPFFPAGHGDVGSSGPQAVESATGDRTRRPPAFTGTSSAAAYYYHPGRRPENCFIARPDSSPYMIPLGEPLPRAAEAFSTHAIHRRFSSGQ